MKCFRVGWGLAEIIQERFRRFEVGRVEPFSESIVDGLKNLGGTG